MLFFLGKLFLAAVKFGFLFSAVVISHLLTTLVTFRQGL